MTKHLRQLLAALADSFGLIPGVMVLAGILAAVGLVTLDRSGLVPGWLVDSAWLYNGGGTGARTLLGAVAGSSIGVAGTVFSITIAALSLAAGQMGPRLLRNFTHDRGNQITLGAFLGTFSYALMVLRSVRTQGEGEFVPHLSMSVGILLAFMCVGTLVYFVAHMAGRINVDTVIELVSGEVRQALERIGTHAPQPPPPDAAIWRHATVVHDARRGYVERIDADSLADWAATQQLQLRLLVRPGNYVFPGSAIALAMRPGDAAAAIDAGATALVAAAIVQRTTLKAERSSADDPEYAVRQLVEVAVRALSPGINDPHTAMNALDRLGAALCDVSTLRLPSGAHERGGRCVLVVPAVTYSGLVDAMFHLVRQNAAGSAAVLIHMLEVLTAVACCERAAERLADLQRHADLILGDANRDIRTPADLADLRHRHLRCSATVARGPLASIDGVV